MKVEIVLVLILIFLFIPVRSDFCKGVRVEESFLELEVENAILNKNVVFLTLIMKSYFKIPLHKVSINAGKNTKVFPSYLERIDPQESLKIFMEIPFETNAINLTISSTEFLKNLEFEIINKENLSFQIFSFSSPISFVVPAFVIKENSNKLKFNICVFNDYFFNLTNLSIVSNFYNFKVVPPKVDRLLPGEEEVFFSLELDSKNENKSVKFFLISNEIQTKEIEIPIIEREENKTEKLLFFVFIFLFILLIVRKTQYYLESKFTLPLF
ncbi:MAG: hypothetical protein QXD89_00575 [Candidatus Aenigmatarchaeota archaeon]